MSTDSQTHTSSAQVQERSAALVPAIAALFLGVFVIFGAGFAGSETLHNAAHDSRHAFAFPCH